MPDEQKTDDLPQSIEEALAAEDDIRQRAEAIRAEVLERRSADDTGTVTTRLTGDDLFLKLWPLLREPIPKAFIRHVGKTEGKPYPSTGVSSVQVQISRMDNVLTPLGWWWEDRYEKDGKLCTVTVYVGEASGSKTMRLAGEYPDGMAPLLESRPYLLARSARGGVERGSSQGNIYKGSFTNAAKLALARVGPGWEIYLGATDLDPDVSAELADRQPQNEPGKITAKEARKLVDHVWDADEKDRLRLIVFRLTNTEPGDCSTKAKAAKELASILTPDQAVQLDQWLSDQIDKAAAAKEAAK